MSIPRVLKDRFHAVLNANTEGVALVECQDSRLNAPVYIIALVVHNEDTQTMDIIPVARMLSDADFDDLIPPDPEIVEVTVRIEDDDEDDDDNPPA